MLQQGTQLAQGKTKIVWNVVGEDRLVILENKSAITANDDPNLTREIKSKAISATTTTCRIFELLRDAEIPVAYEQQISPTSFLAPKAEMIPLEVVVRRYAVGSYLKRYPNLQRDEKWPYRFDQLVVEFFLKTSGGSLKIGDTIIVEGLDPKAGEEDPLIVDPDKVDWRLFHPKKPGWDLSADLKREVAEEHRLLVIPDFDALEKMATIAKQAFLVIEAAWAQLGYRLIDYKVEFSRDLKIADVIDNDSWRLRDEEWNEVSKQLFRDGHSLAEVEDKYELVARLSERLRVPDQALVFWRGSESDECPDEFKLFGVQTVNIVCSGHKSTRKTLAELSETEMSFPDGGVIIALVGRSNGLGPILAAHTTWPVIAVPLTLDTFPGDAWSSIRMPSKVPMATVWPAKNAVEFALNILAQKNPALQAFRRLQVESLEE